MTDVLSGDPEFEAYSRPIGRGKKQSSARVPEGDHKPDDIDRFLAGRDQNDIGNAERLAKRYGDEISFVPGLGWHGWTGTHWSRKFGDDLALELAKKTAKGIWREVQALREAKNEDRADFLTAHGLQSGNIGKIKAMMEAAQPSLRCEMDQLDLDPYLLCTAAATVRICPEQRTVERDRCHRITKLAETEYCPGAKCEKWLAFIKQTFPDEELRCFVQRAAGYSATGDMSEESFFMCWGKGRNGKGTFLRLISFVLGEYAATIPIDLLLEGSPKTGNEPSPQYAALAGVRYVITTEPSFGARFNEGEIKTLTGRDTIRIRGLYGTPFDLVPKFKLWVACNDRPSVRSASDAYWRRVKLIPFVTNISEDETNPNLEQELRQEAPGILNWILEGTAEWSVRGLAPPEMVRMANQSYRDEMDPLQRFLQECTELAIGQAVTRQRLYSTYEQWCRTNGEDPLKTRSFGMAMTSKGYRRHHSNGTQYADIKLSETGTEMQAQAFERMTGMPPGWDA